MDTITATRCKHCHNVLIGFEQLGDECNGCAEIAAHEDNDPSLHYWATYPLDEYTDSLPDRDYCPCCLHVPCICQSVIDQGARGY